MTKKILGLGVVLFSLASAIPTSAQEIATLALRNGQRPSGELIDMNGSEFVLRVDGQTRTFSQNDVAAVEFVIGPLPGDAQARVNAGQALVLLRSGQVVEGRLSDIGGTRPLRLTVDTPSGQRDFSSAEVAQLHLAPLNGAASGNQAVAAPAPVMPAGAIAVSAAQSWTDTGVTVRRGDLMTFTATGDVNLSPTASSGVAGSPAVTNPAARYPLQTAYAGALIGRIGTGAPFLIGSSSQPIAMNAAGRLMLGVNDDQLQDNSGNYMVAMTLSGSTSTGTRSRSPGQ